MNKIPTSFKTQATSTQAHKTEKASQATIFSRGKSSGSKLFFSLKNLFSRTDKSSASSAVAKVIPQAPIGSIGTKNEKSSSSEFDQRTRLRMAYRNFLDPSETGLGSRGKEQGYEEKVSIFDSAIVRLKRGDELKDWEEKALDQVLPKLKTAVEENGKLDASMIQQLLSDLSHIRKDLTHLQLKSALKKAAQQGSE